MSAGSGHGSQQTFRDHKRIIFNGNGYDEAWIREAGQRGLSNYASTPEAFAHYLDEKNIRVFTENGIMSEAECRSRYEIYLEKYIKSINIEARTLLDMMKKDILPASQCFEKRLLDTLTLSRSFGFLDDGSYEMKTFMTVRGLKNEIVSDVESLEASLNEIPRDELLRTAFYYHDRIISLMDSIRKNTDELELLVDRQLWPMPTYKELLFGVD